MYRIITTEKSVIKKALNEIIDWRDEKIEEAKAHKLFDLDPNEGSRKRALRGVVIDLGMSGAQLVRRSLIHALGKDGAERVFFDIMRNFSNDLEDYSVVFGRMLLVVEEVIGELEWALIKGDLS